VACEPGVSLDRDRIAAQRLLARLDEVGESVGVALGRQVALELGDEQAPVGQDQDSERARCLDEARRGDRLAGRGRMAEAIAPGGRRILADEALRLVVVPRLDRLVPSSDFLGSSSASAMPFPFSSSAWRWFAAISSSASPRARRSVLASSVPAASWAAFEERRARGRQEAENPSSGRGSGAAGSISASASSNAAASRRAPALSGSLAGMEKGSPAQSSHGARRP
jgi:hypothetical protein